MEEKVLIELAKYQEFLVPCIFTQKQMSIIKKAMGKEKLNNAENKQYYTSIKTKVKGLSMLSRPTTFFASVKNPVKGRLERAEQMLKDLPHSNAFISGSFLYSEKYNDIDIFIVGKKKEEEKKGEIHMVYIPKRALHDPAIQSAARSSLSKFFIPCHHVKAKLSLYDHMQIFQETAALVFAGKDAAKDARDIIFYHYLKKGRLLSSEELFALCSRFSKLGKKQKLSELKKMVKEILASYGKGYIRRELMDYEKVLDKEIREFRMNEHLKYYKESYREAIA